MPTENDTDKRASATPLLSQRDRLLVAETLERIAARTRRTGDHHCEVYSTPMHASDLLLVADALRMDYDGDDVELVTVARDEAERSGADS